MNSAKQYILSAEFKARHNMNNTKNTNNMKNKKQKKTSSCHSRTDTKPNTKTETSLSELISRSQKRVLRLYKAQLLSNKGKASLGGPIPFPTEPSQLRYGKTPAERNIYIMKVSKDVRRIMSQPFLEILQIIDSDVPNSVFDFRLEKPMIINFLEEEITNTLPNREDTPLNLTPWNITLKDVIHIMDINIFELSFSEEDTCEIISDKKASGKEPSEKDFSDKGLSDKELSDKVFSGKGLSDKELSEKEAPSKDIPNKGEMNNDFSNREGGMNSDFPDQEEEMHSDFPNQEEEMHSDLMNPIYGSDIYIDIITRMIFITYILPMLFAENEYDSFADNSNKRLMEKWHSIFSYKTKGTNL